MLTVRVNDADSTLFREYASMNGMSVSELVRSSVLERIEQDCDLKVYKEALAEYKKDPVTYTLDEVKQEILAQ